ncbi:MAG: CHAD domain-containing protein [Parvularculaceae bacterium]
MSFSKIEFELKLVGPPSDVEAVRELDFVRRALRGDGEWAQLRSTYYDSAERRLAKRGLSLRIREEAGVSLLTAKIEDAGQGAVKRREYERAIDPGALNFTTGFREFDEIIGPATDDIAPFARTETNRWSGIASELGSVFEMSSEIGFSERFAPERRAAPIAEVEIELLKGPPDALFDWARRLIGASGGRLRLSVEAKLDRALRAGASPRFGKAPRGAISPTACAADIFSAALPPIAMRVIEASAQVAAAHDREAARQLRVALRRLRSLVRLFEKDLGDDRMARLADEAKSYARLVGVARDLENFSARNLRKAGAPPELVARAESRSAAAWSRAARALDDENFGLFSVNLLEAAMTENWRAESAAVLSGPARPYTDKKLEKRKRKLETVARRADFADPASLHAVRIALKKLRYAAQFFRGLYDRDASAPFFSAMAALQDVLGDINDAASAQEIANDIAEGLGPQSAKAAGFIAGYRCAEASLRAENAKEAWETFAALSPFWKSAPETPAP